MRFVRTILAFAIAASLALLPIGASAAAFSMASDNSQISMRMDASNDMSMVCCPDDMQGSPSHTDHGKCSMAFCCIGAAIALGDVRTAIVQFLSPAGIKFAIPADQTVPVCGGSPPFRPPRV